MCSHGSRSQEKKSATFLDRYGTENYLLSEDYQQKAEVTNQNRYGEKYAAKSDIVQERIKNTNLSKFLNNFESRVYAQLSTQLVNNLFGENPKSDKSYKSFEPTNNLYAGLHKYSLLPPL